LFGGDVFLQTPELQKHMPGAPLVNDGVSALRLLATTTPQVSDWRPPYSKLAAARALDALRHQVTGETIQQFMEPMVRAAPHEPTEFRHGMMHSALFLTDAVMSALAFDTPELMDRQARWLAGFTPAHEISLESVEQFLGLYRAVTERFLNHETARPVGEMLTRLGDALQGHGSK
jgi:hypothetical protein